MKNEIIQNYKYFESAHADLKTHNKKKEGEHPIGLIALDFDGTCSNYNPVPHIDNTVSSQLQQGRRQGTGWVLNSDRTFKDLLSIVEQLPKKNWPRAILSQQREIHFLSSRGYFYPHKEWNDQKVEFHNKLWECIQPYFDEWSSTIQRLFEIRMKFINEGHFSFMVHPEKVELLGAVLAEFIEDWPDAVISGNHEWRFITHRTFSKGVLLSEASNCLRVPASRILAIGDSVNDMSMFDPKVAMRVGCPANSCQKVREHVSNCSGVVAQQKNAKGTSYLINYFMNISCAEC